jgi:hypothetical protein
MKSELGPLVRRRRRSGRGRRRAAVWLPVWVRQLYCRSTGRLKQSSLGLRLRVRARRLECSSKAFGSPGGTWLHGGEILLDASLFEAGFGEVLRGANEDAGPAADGGAQGAEVAAGLGGEEEDDLLGFVGTVTVTPSSRTFLCQVSISDEPVVGRGIGGAAQEGQRRGDSGDDAVADGDDAVGELGDVGLVGDDDDGVALGVEIVEERHDLVAGLGVEVAGGFVGEDDGGLVDQGAGDGDALALAAGELVGLVHHAGAEVDGLEDGLGAGDALGGGGAVVDEGQLDVVQRGGAGEQVEGLEDEADLLVADAGEFVVVELADVVAVEPVLALGRGVEAADEVHQRRLAGAGGAHDGDVLVVLDAQVDAAQGVDLLVAHLVGLPEIVGDDDVAGTGAVGVGVGFGADFSDFRVGIRFSGVCSVASKIVNVQDWTRWRLETFRSVPSG